MKNSKKKHEPKDYCEYLTDKFAIKSMSSKLLKVVYSELTPTNKETRRIIDLI